MKKSFDLTDLVLTTIVGVTCIVGGAIFQRAINDKTYTAADRVLESQGYQVKDHLDASSPRQKTFVLQRHDSAFNALVTRNKGGYKIDSAKFTGPAKTSAPKSGK